MSSFAGEEGERVFSSRGVKEEAGGLVVGDSLFF